MWMQIVGKTRLQLTPLLNHWWNVPLYVSARGLTTSPMPYSGDLLEIEFDFVSHDLRFRLSSGAILAVPLRPQTVASFYAEYQRCLATLGVSVEINPVPVEISDPIPFPEDEVHHAYDPEYAHRWWRILLSTATVLSEFRSRFIGKCSPVHFFWGSFDLSCTRFSGRPAPPRKGVITSEAYSHECISAGFWPGGGPIPGAAFYSYTAPQPPGLQDEPIRPAAAGWNKDLSEFILMYEDVRRAESPRAALLEFLESTYAAGAKLASWDRAALDRK